MHRILRKPTVFPGHRVPSLWHSSWHLICRPNTVLCTLFRWKMTSPVLWLVQCESYFHCHSSCHQPEVFIKKKKNKANKVDFWIFLSKKNWKKISQYNESYWDRFFVHVWYNLNNPKPAMSLPTWIWFNSWSLQYVVFPLYVFNLITIIALVRSWRCSHKTLTGRLCRLFSRCLNTCKGKISAPVITACPHSDISLDTRRWTAGQRKHC